MFDIRQLGLPKLVKDEDGKDWVALYQVNVEGNGDLSNHTVIYLAVDATTKILPAPCMVIRCPLVE